MTDHPRTARAYLPDQRAAGIGRHRLSVANNPICDIGQHRNIDAVVTQIRREMAAACLAKADEWGEPSLNEQD